MRSLQTKFVMFYGTFTIQTSKLDEVKALLAKAWATLITFLLILERHNNTSYVWSSISTNLCDKLTMFERIKLYGIIFSEFNGITYLALKYSLSSPVILRENLRQKWHNKRAFISHSY